MEIKQLTVGVISTVIAVLMVITVAVPTITNAVETNKIDNTESGYTLDYAREYALGDTVTITRSANSDSFTVNGVSYVTKGAEWVLISDAMSIQEFPSAESGLHFRFADSAFTDIPLTSSSASAVDLTFHNGKINGSVGSKTLTDVEYTWLYALAENGNYISVSPYGTTPGQRVISSNDNVVTAIFPNIGDAWEYGALKDGKLFWNVSEDYTVTYVTESYDTMQALTKISVHVGSQDIEEAFCLIPKVAEKAEHTPINALVQIVPLLLLVGIVIGAVGMFLRARD